MMATDEELKEKKLRGSGGYIIARISDQEQKKGNLGGPELFIAGIGRLPKDRILKYYCNKCEKDYKSSPTLTYDNPNEEVGEGDVLIEKDEYKCSVCSAVMSQYRISKFPNESEQQVISSNIDEKNTLESKYSDITDAKSTNITIAKGKDFPIQ